MRVAVLEAVEPHERHRLGDRAASYSRLGHVLVAQAEGDVLRHRQVREERVVLEDHVDRPLVGRHVGDVGSRRCGSSPSVGSSKPPIIRSSVVLPQPEGPSREKNSPRRIASETSSTATKSPKRLLTRSISTLVSLVTGASRATPSPMCRPVGWCSWNAGGRRPFYHNVLRHPPRLKARHERGFDVRMTTLLRGLSS